MYDTPDSQAVAGLLTEVLSQGEAAPDVGLSIVFFPVWESISTFLLPCTLRLPKPPRNLDYLPHNNLLRDPNYLNILISTI